MLTGPVVARKKVQWAIVNSGDFFLSKFELLISSVGFGIVMLKRNLISGISLIQQENR